jgi:hypothetical protein
VGNVPPRSVEVIENIPWRCAISAKLGTRMTKIGINKYPGNAGEMRYIYIYIYTYILCMYVCMYV